MGWLVMLIAALLGGLAYDMSCKRQSNKKVEAMRKAQAFRPQNITEWAGLYAEYQCDWYRGRKKFPPNLIPLFEKNPKLREQYERIKVAQIQWAQGYMPYGYVVNSALAELNPDPDLQYTAFMNMYAPQENKE